MSDLQYTVGITDAASNKLRVIENNVQKLNLKFEALRSAIAGLALGAAIQRSIQFADAIQDIGDATGIATGTILAFGAAVQDSGGNAEGANNSLLKLVQTIGDAVDGSDQAQKAFAAVGISLEDIQTLSEQELLAKTINGLGKMDDATKRISAQVALFGKNARGVNFQNVAQQFAPAAAQSQQYERAIKAASDAQGNLEVNIRNFTIALLKVIEPVTKLVSEIRISVEAFEALGKVIAGAAIVGGFAALGKGLYSLAKLINSTIFNALRTLNTGLTTAVMASRTFANTAKQLTSAIQLSAGPFSALLAILGLIGGALLKFGSLIFKFLAGPWGMLITGVILFKEELLSYIPTLGPVFDFVAKGFEKIKNAMGFGDAKPKAFEQADIRRIDNATVAIDQASEKAQEFQERLNKVAREIRKIGEGYSENNTRQLQNISNEIALIGLSETQIEKQRQLNQSLLEQENIIKELNNRREQYANGTEEQKRSLGVIDQEIARVKQLGEEYRKQLATRLDSYQQAVTLDKVRLFGLEQQIQLETQLTDIQTEIATMLLPEIERRYYRIEAAAKAAATAQIRAEETRLGRNLSPEEAQKYYDISNRGVDKLKNAQNELVQQQEKLSFRGFQIQQENKLTQQLTTLNDDLAKLTMTTLEKKYYDIEAAAKASARAEIQAAEARLGRKLSAEEAQKYYDAASKGVDELKQKTMELYEASRTFETGWKQAFNSYIEDATNSATRAGDIFKSFTSNMESAIDKFVDTGKFSFKDFANSIIKDILKIELKAAAANIFGALRGGFGGGGGGLFGGAIIPGFLADGGPATAGKPYVVGEEGPELFVPKGSGTVIPNNLLPSGSGGQTINNYNYNISAVDGQSVARLFANNRQLMLGTVEQARKELPVRQGRR